MNRANGLLRRLTFSILLLWVFVFIAPVLAGIPSVDDVVVRAVDDHTVLDVTVNHLPASPPVHYVDRIIVNVDGTNKTFDVTQTSVTFTHACDLGVVEGTPTVLVWAHCNVNGDSTEPYGPLQIPEFSTFTLLLALTLAATLKTLAVRRTHVRG